MPAVYCKYQKCGKNNCRCHSGALHGPYFWLINYQRKTSTTKASYRWVYLGRSPEIAFNRLRELYGRNLPLNLPFTSETEGDVDQAVLQAVENARKKATQRIKESAKKTVSIKLIDLEK
ncbi:MAG: DUF6788 family protein [Candidatus Hodarchaeales archaeon]